MATINRIVDDYNHDLDAQTRTFELLGQTFEIDIADANLDFFSSLVNNAQELVKKARPVNGRSETGNAKSGISSHRGSRSDGNGNGKSRTVTAKVTATRKPAKPRKKHKTPAAKVRKWAQENGVEVSPTGIVQQSTYDAYNKAHNIKE